MAAPDPSFWRQRRVLVTGHTGFKGSWLTLWLQALGAQVHGLALAPPTTPSLHDVAGLGARAPDDEAACDVRDAEAVHARVAQVRPEIVLHLAAQPLVRLSYTEPLATYATNVMGTAHVLDAVRRVGGVRAVVSVTTDKCYENREWLWGYREDEALGGHDPYSSSKAGAELVTAAWRRSFLAAAGCAVASARAGNVIGGGDWAADRLVPDALRAFEAGRPVVLRHPHATRPWQHVLEPLAGYLLLAEALHAQGDAVAEAWNFGPADTDARPVQWIVERLARLWGDGARWDVDPGTHAHEAHSLRLDCTKARSRLGWTPVWPLHEALERIVAWHLAWRRGDDMAAFSRREIADYTEALSALAA